MIQIRIIKELQVTNQASFPTMEEAQAWLSSHEGMGTFGGKRFDLRPFAIETITQEPQLVEISPAVIDSEGIEISPAVFDFVEIETSPAVFELKEVEISPAQLDSEGIEISPAQFELRELEITPAQFEKLLVDVTVVTYEDRMTEVNPAGYEVEITDISAQLEQEKLNAEAQAFLDSTDFKVLRHIRQKALQQELSLSEEQYLALEQERADAAAKIVK